MREALSGGLRRNVPQLQSPMSGKFPRHTAELYPEQVSAEYDWDAPELQRTPDVTRVTEAAIDLYLPRVLVLNRRLSYSLIAPWRLSSHARSRRPVRATLYPPAIRRINHPNPCARL